MTIDIAVSFVRTKALLIVNYSFKRCSVISHYCSTMYMSEEIFIQLFLNTRASPAKCKSEGLFVLRVPCFTLREPEVDSCIKELG